AWLAGQLATRGPDGSASIDRIPTGVIDEQIARAERWLYAADGKGCGFSHAIKPGRAEDGGLPAIVPTALPSRFLPRARFDHARHTAAALGQTGVAGAPDCLACHLRAVESRRTSDVLVPGIATCRRCHGSTEGRAP